MNSCLFIGNLTRDPEVQFTTGGTAVCNFSIALNRKWKDKTTNQMKEEVTFLDMVAWGKTAELVGEYLSKGKQVAIRASAEQQTWDDKETGNKRSKIVFRVDEVKFLGGAGGNSEGGNSEGSNSGTKRQSAKQQQQPSDNGDDGDYGGGSDEIPF